MAKNNHDLTLSRLQQQTLHLLESPPEKRSPEEINNILHWIQNRTQVLKEVETECLTTLIKYSECQTVSRDDIIIQQGEPGECFYITLVGSVSIYVNPQIEEECENTQMSATTTHSWNNTEKPPPKEKFVTNEPKHNKTNSQNEKEVAEDDANNETLTKKLATRIDRTKFGTFVIKLCEGHGFGEAALIRNCKRTATVIANDKTSLMVIRRELFVRTLKDYLENDYAKRRTLIENSALFKGWKKRHKQRLELSLIRKTCAFDSIIINQGDPWKGLIFIAEGQAKIQVKPSRHNIQYKELAPFSEEIDIYKLELNRPKRSTTQTGNEEAMTSARAEKEQVYIRRKEGYAAAERRVQNKIVNMCTVERGDIIGDIEIVTDLKTYLCSVTATTNMELYFLSPDNFKRLISKTSPESQTYNTLQDRVKTKLTTRICSKQGGQIPLFKHLLNKLETQDYSPYTRPVVEPKTAPLPDSNVMFEHLMSSYLEDKAELVTPRVAGGIYYRDLARIKMKQRELYPDKELEVLKTVKKNRKIKVRRINPHAPRTSTALKKAIEQARDQQLNEAKQKLIKEAREKEHVEIQAVKQRLQRSVSESVLERQSNLLIKDQQEKGCKDTIECKKPELQNKNVNGKPEVSAGTFVTSLNKKHQNDDITQDIASEHQETDKAFTLPRIKSSDKMANFSKRGARLTHSVSVQQFPSTISEGSSVNQKKKLGLLSKSGSKSYECLLEPTHATDTPHLASKELTTFSDFEGLRDSLEPVICENPSYRDWETSDNSMTYLEEKVKDFILRQNVNTKKETLSSLPKLQRYECKDNEEQPIQGGKVLVKSSSCPLSTNSRAVKRYHEHTRCNLLPSIPEYWSLRKQRMVRQAIKDEDRKSWLKKHETKEDKPHVTAVTN